MQDEHSPENIAKRLSQPPPYSYLRDWVYGGIDGTVTTFAVVSGVAGSRLSAFIILVLGFVNLIADGFSMAASNFLGTRAEQEEYLRKREIEEFHIAHYPQGEKQEVRQILQNEGFTDPSLTQLTDLICSNRQMWIDIMLHKEYGLPISVRSPWRAALSTFFAFLCCGLVPLLPFIFIIPHQYLTSLCLTGGVFFFIGSLKSRWTSQAWWRSGLTTFAIGTSVALLAYGVGFLFHIYLLEG
jgi:VIT1/CCC1 family predicted Fe2+/Mn2+ transporter